MECCFSSVYDDVIKNTKSLISIVEYFDFRVDVLVHMDICETHDNLGPLLGNKLYSINRSNFPFLVWF